MRLYKKLVFIPLLFLPLMTQCYKVGLLVVATGKYIQFVQPLIDSADKYFCKNHEVTYFVFTDGKAPEKDNLISIYQKRLGWPYDTMMRCKMYYDNKDNLQNMDYLFACDADMLFVNEVGDEILFDRVATQHPGYVGKRGTYEIRTISKAYVKPGEGTHYFAGGFHGGNRDEFLKLSQTMMQNILEDLSKNIIAIWHDESHLNRYFIDNPPTKILSPSYCCPGSDYLVKLYNLMNYKKKIIALVKDHQVFHT